MATSLLFSNFLIPRRLLTFFNWSTQVMCNQLPSDSISTASQILGLLVSLADSERSLGRQPSRASAEPNRCQEREILWRRVLHSSFIPNIIFVLLFWQTSWTLRYRNGTFVRCHNALCHPEIILQRCSLYSLFIVRGKHSQCLFYNIVSYALHHPVAFTSFFFFFLTSTSISALYAHSLRL